MVSTNLIKQVFYLLNFVFKSLSKGIEQSKNLNLFLQVFYIDSCFSL